MRRTKKDDVEMRLLMVEQSIELCKARGYVPQRLKKRALALRKQLNTYTAPYREEAPEVDEFDVVHIPNPNSDVPRW